MHPTSTYRRHGLFPEPLAPLMWRILPVGLILRCDCLACCQALKNHGLPLFFRHFSVPNDVDHFLTLHQVICRALASHSMRKQATGTQRGAQLFRPANDQQPRHTFKPCTCFACSAFHRHPRRARHRSSQIIADAFSGT